MKIIEHKYVKECFNQVGSKLLDQYKNAHTKMRFICQCGNEHKVSWAVFKSSHNPGKCRICIQKSIGDNSRKYSIDDIKLECDKKGFTLITNEYQGYSGKYEHICKCGLVYKSTFSNIQRKNGCKKCSPKTKIISAYGKKFNRDIEEIKKIFQQNNCELLSQEYKGYDFPLSFKCKCGNIEDKKFSRFILYPLCKKCSAPKQGARGEKNYKWNPNREEITRNYTFATRCRNILKRCLNIFQQQKHDKTYDILGYTAVDLIKHIESFNSWNEIKKQKWAIDHIFPIKAFIDYGLSDLKLINCLDNLQPLTFEENGRKCDSYNKEQFEEFLKRKGYNV